MLSLSPLLYTLPCHSLVSSLLVFVTFRPRLTPPIRHSYLGTGDLRLLDHDEGRCDEGALSDIIDWIVGHGLQQIDSLLSMHSHNNMVT